MKLNFKSLPHAVRQDVMETKKQEHYGTYDPAKQFNPTTSGYCFCHLTNSKNPRVITKACDHCKGRSLC